jgi:hypothetical protein
MKVGVSYNLWKGEELLPYSIKTIRNEVDYIVVVYQNLSNYKQDRPNLTPLLESMVSDGLIDEIIYYEPDFSVEKMWWGTHNELIKRNLGLEACRKQGCTYLVDCDADEIYETKQFTRALQMIDVGGYDSGFVKSITYYKKPTSVLLPPEKKYTPFIYKIKPHSKFEPIENEDFPCIVDGKRRVKCGYSYLFEIDELVMHHFSYVRINDEELRMKFENCSSNMNFSKDRVNQIVEQWNNFNIGECVEFGKDEVYKTIEVENKFNIKMI